jgi:RimJ/RimL family protein N-acetyltransferase
MRLDIQTPRLRLRPFEPGDAARVAELAGDYNVAKMCSRVPYPYSAAEAGEKIARHAGLRENGVGYIFAVTLAPDGEAGDEADGDSGELIGSCGAFAVNDGRAFEIGFWFGRPYWGNGYATEAVQALMDWAGVELGPTLFRADHFADNPASGGVLRKLGFGRSGAGVSSSLAREGDAPTECYVWPAAAVGAIRRPHAPNRPLGK